MSKKTKEVDILEVNEAEIMPKETAQQPNVVFTRQYFDIAAGTQKYFKTIPLNLNKYVTGIS